MAINEPKFGVVDVPPESAANAAPKAVEACAENVSITSEVSGPCKNPEGRFVGLSPLKREKLGVELGDLVTIKGHGVFTVAPALKENLGHKLVAVNGLPVGTEVTIQKMEDGADVVIPLTITHGIESDPKHETRRSKIAARYSDFDPDVYMCIPTSLASALGLPLTSKPDEKRTYAIAMSIVKIDGVVHEVPLVPTGSNIGLTTKAAVKFNIPTGLTDVPVRIDKGVLVI